MNNTPTTSIAIPQEVAQDIATRQAWAKSLVIHSPAERIDALAVVQAVKARTKTVLESFEESVRAAHAAHKTIVAQRDTFLAPLREIEAAVKSAVMRYYAEQDRIRQEEQRRLQAIADEQARKERERLEKEAAKLKTPELKAARLEQAASIVAPVIQIPTAAPKVDGESVVKVWKFSIVDPSAVPREYLAIDEQKIGAVVRATKGTVRIPGIETYAENSIRMRA